MTDLLATEPAWLRGLLGGLLIGLSAAGYLLLNGRIAGMTGILVSALTRPHSAEGRDSLAFLLTAFTVPLAALLAGAPLAVEVTPSLFALIAGGLIVGVGITLSNGCTSGHGVCGLSRLSVRSMAATATFMIGTAASVFVIRHLAGVSP